MFHPGEFSILITFSAKNDHGKLRLDTGFLLFPLLCYCVICCVHFGHTCSSVLGKMLSTVCEPSSIRCLSMF